MSETSKPPTLTPEEEAAYEKYHSWSNFLSLHQTQFEAMKLPKALWKTVHRKLYTEERLKDATDIFELVPPTSDNVAELKVKVNQKRWNDVWIIPHLVAEPKQELYKQLCNDDELRERLWKMMNLDAFIEPAPTASSSTTSNTSSTTANTSTGTTATSTSEGKSSNTTKSNIESNTIKATPVKAVTPDPLMIEMIQSEYPDISKEKIESALILSQNDLVEAMTLCQAPDKEREELEKKANQLVSSAVEQQQQSQQQSQSKQGNDEKEDTKTSDQTNNNNKNNNNNNTVDTNLLNDKIVRAKTVFTCLFKYHFINQYLVSAPKEGALTAQDIIVKYYVMDEYGSAISFSPTPNAIVASLVCLTLNNASYSIMWFEKDAKAGDLVTRTQPTIM